MSDRCIDARQSRLDLAEVVSRVLWPDHVNNGEEGDYPYLANYSKGLPHNDVGEVDTAAYNALLRALSTQDNQDFERVLVQLRQLIDVDLARLEKQLESAGAPWTPGRIPEWKDQP